MLMDDDGFTAALTAVCLLGDPVRRALYQYVAEQAGAVGREEASRAVRVPVHVAKFHLDRLHRIGLLDVDYRRPPGRGGPGAGRPAKLYRRSSSEFAVTIPERRYDVAGLIMSRALADAWAGDVAIGTALERAAGRAGEVLGLAARSVLGKRPSQAAILAAARDALAGQGFEPRAAEDGLVLGNCPFRTLANQAPEVVCRMNVALVAGLLHSLGTRKVSARLEPAQGRCCVTVRAD
jgi:predicted ArsR family transcriptional regulator